MASPWSSMNSQSSGKWSGSAQPSSATIAFKPTFTDNTQQNNQSNEILKDAKVTYKDRFLSEVRSNELLEKFKNLDWKIRKYKNMTLNRYTAAYGDEDITAQAPRIWGEDIVINPWIPELKELKDKIEKEVGEKYNICLCNYYQSGKQYIGMHSDNEEYGSTKSIASISLGAEREFIFESKNTSEKKIIKLKSGSLLVMGENCQENYRHGMKRDYTNERINITFRKFIF
jgi:alkylated DNA repair dioxygenase AlkB